MMNRATPAGRAPRQRTLDVCPCGEHVAIVPTADPRQFLWGCLACGRSGEISWDAGRPAPVWHE